MWDGKQYIGSIRPEFTTCVEAMKSFDDALINAGFTLLTQEQYDKLKTLL
jgi:hypothetical protein